MTGWRWTHSLRFRLLAATLAALTLALVLAGLLLNSLFHEHVMRQYEATLSRQLDQLTARLEFDATGQPRIDANTLSDPRWVLPYSGLYWQLDRVSTDAGARSGVLRSRSLWDATLGLETDALADGDLHVHQGSGPQGAALLMLERTVSTAEQPGALWRLIVAGDLQESTQAVQRFTGVLSGSLLGLGLLLGLAALAQVAVGLAPLRTLQRALGEVRAGHTPRLQGRFPQEIQPLIDDFNGVLDQNAAVVARSRTHAGNLAHALKTPLTVMAQAAAEPQGAQPSELAGLVREQVALARRHIDWHLSHARAAAAQRLPGQRTALAPVLAGLLRVMERVHAARELDLHGTPVPDSWAFAGEAQDLHEMLGNLLENACQWARHSVLLAVSQSGDSLQILLDDDGPGIPPAQRQAVLTRGVRLDENTPGTGLGLAIAADLASLYGGQLALEDSPLGGLRVRLSLPSAAPLPA
jgi:signal transduction histidine kinase